MGPCGDPPMLEPRVVIMDRGCAAEVGLVEIPVPVTVGVEFEHEGRRWQVVARRGSTRVLLASESSGRPLEA